MAKINTWTEDITIETDWGGDESTGFAPVSGGSIQRFLKGKLISLEEALVKNQERDEENESTTAATLTDLENRLSVVEIDYATEDFVQSELNSRIAALDGLIQELSETIQEVKDRELIKVVTKSEWENLKESGLIKEGVLYGIIDESGSDEPEIPTKDNITIEYDSETEELIIIGPITIDEDDILEVIGEYDEETETLTIVGGESGQIDDRDQVAGFDNEDNLMLMGSNLNYNESEEILTVLGNYNDETEELTIIN